MPPTCSSGRASRPGGAAGAAAGGGGCASRSGRSAASTSWPPRSATRILREWNDTARAVPRRDPAGAVRGAGGATPDAVAVVFEEQQPELSRARCARQPAGASSARARRRPRDRGGAVRRALARRCWSGCSASSRPAAPICRSTPTTRRSGWPSCWRMRARRCWSRSPRCASGCRDTSARICGSMPTAAAIAARPTAAPAHRARPAQPRLCHLHLGSTGTPKGVAVEHAGLANKVLTLRRGFRSGPGVRWALLSSSAFDPSIEQATLPLVHGASVVVISEAIGESPPVLGLRGSQRDHVS